ncbi:GNAT family N-acetyltransferase [Devosia sp. FKR38]|uniref:GNAT family N-acetyltransferase n=1 Tax=Devosia sp. FKR38 TaxID=2562312 RepID=UPI0010BFB5E4|nr:GNAT family N-acetyltransferase [Devosia sp. FKR38]
MDIRPAREDDFPALCRLDSYAADHLERQAEIGRWIDLGACHVVDAGGTLAAYGVMTTEFLGQHFIALIVVGAGFRRSGIGLTLVRHFQDSCRGRKLFTSTNLSNHPMQSLLLKAGFRSSGYIDNLDEGDPELVFFYPAS